MVLFGGNYVLESGLNGIKSRQSVSRIDLNLVNQTEVEDGESHPTRDNDAKCDSVDEFHGVFLYANKLQMSIRKGSPASHRGKVYRDTSNDWVGRLEISNPKPQALVVIWFITVSKNEEAE